MLCRASLPRAPGPDGPAPAPGPERRPLAGPPRPLPLPGLALPLAGLAPSPRSRRQVPTPCRAWELRGRGCGSLWWRRLLAVTWAGNCPVPLGGSPPGVSATNRGPPGAGPPCRCLAAPAGGTRGPPACGRPTRLPIGSFIPVAGGLPPPPGLALVLGFPAAQPCGADRRRLHWCESPVFSGQVVPWVLPPRALGGPRSLIRSASFFVPGAGSAAPGAGNCPGTSYSTPLWVSLFL